MCSSVHGSVPGTRANFGHVQSVQSVQSSHKRHLETAAMRRRFRTGLRDARNARNARNTEQTRRSLRHGGWNARHAKPSRVVAALGRPLALVGLRAWRRRGARAADSHSGALATWAGGFRRISASLATGSSPDCNADCKLRRQTRNFRPLGRFQLAGVGRMSRTRRGRPSTLAGVGGAAFPSRCPS